MANRGSHKSANNAHISVQRSFPSKPQALAGPRQLLRNICLHIYNHFETGSSANGILITHTSQKLPEVKVWAKCERAKPAVCLCCLFSTWESGHLRPAPGVGSSAFAHLRVCLSQQSSVESPNLEFEYGDADALSAELSGTADRHAPESIPAMEGRIFH